MVLNGNILVEQTLKNDFRPLLRYLRSSRGRNWSIFGQNCRKSGQNPLKFTPFDFETFISTNFIPNDYEWVYIVETDPSALFLTSFEGFWDFYREKLVNFWPKLSKIRPKSFKIHTV